MVLSVMNSMSDRGTVSRFNDTSSNDLNSRNGRIAGTKTSQSPEISDALQMFELETLSSFANDNFTVFTAAFNPCPMIIAGVRVDF